MISKIYPFFFFILLISCSPDINEIADEHKCIECKKFLTQIKPLDNSYRYFVVGEQPFKMNRDPELNSLQDRALGSTLLRIVELKEFKTLMDGLYCFIGYDESYMKQLFPNTIIESQKETETGLVLTLKPDLGNLDKEGKVMHWIRRNSVDLHFEKIEEKNIFIGNSTDNSRLSSCTK